MKDIQRPKIGIGVVIENEKGEILVGKRKGRFPYYSIPGGHLEMGETFEVAAIKEVREETGLIIHGPTVFSVTNNLESFQLTGMHYISVNLYAKSYEGQVQNLEPHKCEGWQWLSPKNIPEPHFDASAYAIECYLKETFYIIKQRKKELR